MVNPKILLSLQNLYINVSVWKYPKVMKDSLWFTKNCQKRDTSITNGLLASSKLTKENAKAKGYLCFQLWWVCVLSVIQWWSSHLIKINVSIWGRNVISSYACLKLSGIRKIHKHGLMLLSAVNILFGLSTVVISSHKRSFCTEKSNNTSWKHLLCQAVNNSLNKWITMLWNVLMSIYAHY